MWAITPSTIVTKLMSTPTCHRATSSCPLNPKITLWALFKFSSFYKLLKLPIIFSVRMWNSIFGTGLTIMIVASTSQAIMLTTNRTSIIVNLFFSSENRCTSWSRTPRDMLVIGLNIVVKTKFIISLSWLAITALVNNIHWNVRSTASWTFNLNFLFPEAGFDVLSSAVPMEWMTAFKSFQIEIFYWFQTNITLLFFIL